jgi:hypothetical protein
MMDRSDFVAGFMFILIVTILVADPNDNLERHAWTCFLSEYVKSLKCLVAHSLLDDLAAQHLSHDNGNSPLNTALTCNICLGGILSCWFKPRAPFRLSA